METIKTTKQKGKIEILTGFENIQYKLKDIYDDEFDETEISGIYAIVIKFNNYHRRYIGSSSNMKKEFINIREQLNENEYKTGQMQQLQQLFNGGSNLWFELLEECDSKDFETLTNKYINLFNTTHERRGWNKENDYCKTQSTENDSIVGDLSVSELSQIRENKEEKKIVSLYNIKTKTQVQGTYQELTSKYGFSDVEIFLIEENIESIIGHWGNVIVFDRINENKNQ